MSDHITNMIEIKSSNFPHYPDGVKIYKIPEGSYLFRGGSGKYLSGIKWFALSYKVALPYGSNKEKNVHIYKTKKDIFLYAMDDINNVKQLIEHLNSSSKCKDAIPDFKPQYINNNFRVADGKLIRHSVVDADYDMVQSLCCLGYDGYGSNEMPDYNNPTTNFHAEIALCDAYTDVLLYEE